MDETLDEQLIFALFKFQWFKRSIVAHYFRHAIAYYGNAY